MHPPFESLMEYIDTLESESISLQRVLTSIPAISRNRAAKGRKKRPNSSGRSSGACPATN